MFDIGWGELLVIGIVALIAIGPKELPGVLRTLGKYVGKIKQMSAEFQSQFQEALREAEVADLKKQADDFTNSIANIENYDVTASENPVTGTDGHAGTSTGSNESSETSSVESPAEQSSADTQASTDQASTGTSEINVPLPEPMKPFFDNVAETPTPPKQAGGGV